MTLFNQLSAEKGSFESDTNPSLPDSQGETAMSFQEDGTAPEKTEKVSGYVVSKNMRFFYKKDGERLSYSRNVPFFQLDNRKTPIDQLDDFFAKNPNYQAGKTWGWVGIKATNENLSKLQIHPGRHRDIFTTVSGQLSKKGNSTISVGDFVLVKYYSKNNRKNVSARDKTTSDLSRLALGDVTESNPTTQKAGNFQKPTENNNTEAPSTATPAKKVEQTSDVPPVDLSSWIMPPVSHSKNSTAVTGNETLTTERSEKVEHNDTKPVVGEDHVQAEVVPKSSTLQDKIATRTGLGLKIEGFTDSDDEAFTRFASKTSVVNNNGERYVKFEGKVGAYSIKVKTSKSVSSADQYEKQLGEGDSVEFYVNQDVNNDKILFSNEKGAIKVTYQKEINPKRSSGDDVTPRRESRSVSPQNNNKPAAQPQVKGANLNQGTSPVKNKDPEKNPSASTNKSEELSGVKNVKKFKNTLKTNDTSVLNNRFTAELGKLSLELSSVLQLERNKFKQSEVNLIIDNSNVNNSNVSTLVSQITTSAEGSESPSFDIIANNKTYQIRKSKTASITSILTACADLNSFVQKQNPIESTLAAFEIDMKEYLETELQRE